MNVLVKMTGSIACYKACDLISRLVGAGHAVQTVTSAGAEQFIGAATLEGLTGRPNLGNLWKTGDQMAHIRLPEWADVVILCPATANTINKLAQGAGDDLISTLFLAHDFSKPYFIAPAMNPRMMRHPATGASLQKLESWGVRVLPTGEGRLACGDFGFGKLLDPEVIFQTITRASDTGETGNSNSPRVLITAGGTEEPIDSVRVLTNLSSGKTGRHLAEAFARLGAGVTLLRSYRATPATGQTIRQLTFQSIADLETQLRQELAGGCYDTVIHLAAVSDFTLGNTAPLDHKMDSDVPVEITLTPAPKLLPLIKQWAPGEKPPAVVGFKLTDTLDVPDADNPAIALMGTGFVDAVVHNARESINAEGSRHLCRVYLPGGKKVDTSTKDELADILWEFASGNHPVAAADT